MLFFRRINLRKLHNQKTKPGTPLRSGNAYNISKSGGRTTRNAGHDSLPPPPPSYHHHSNEAGQENEYAYISELPPAMPPLPPTPGEYIGKLSRKDSPRGAVGRRQSATSQNESPSHYPSASYELSKSQRNGYLVRAKEVKPPKVPNGIPVLPTTGQMLPKLLAHECALSVQPQQATGSPKRRSSRPGSRLPSDSCDPPTYFELDPETSSTRKTSTNGEESPLFDFESYERPLTKPQHTL